MHIFSGMVREAAQWTTDPDAIAESAARHTAMYRRAPSEAECRSWEQSWPQLLRVLMAAGLDGLGLVLEYELPMTSERVDALLLGRKAGRLVAVVVELKQWTKVSPRPAPPGSVWLRDRSALLPSRQAGGYVTALRYWLPEEAGVEVRGVALLHNGSAAFVRRLRELAGDGPSAAFPTLGADDVADGTASGVLAERLRCADLEPVGPVDVAAFLALPVRPSRKALDRVAANIDGEETFTLVGQQDLARVHVLDAVRRAEQGHLIVVTGGPGTGKTAIAARLLGDMCGKERANPRLLSPSGTLTRQLQRKVGDASRGLIRTLTSTVPHGLDQDRSVVLLDEAHRARTERRCRPTEFPEVFVKLLRESAVLVVFLDERQVVRPREGTSLEELRRTADAAGSTFLHVDLPSQFRCGGSRTYLNWIDELLKPHGGRVMPWRSDGYDVAPAENPAELDEWLGAHIARGADGRIAAGFCWPWTSPRTAPLTDEVRITWTDAAGSHTWARPWNAGASGQSAGDGVPGREFWATDPGGERQVGCVYTAQGLEYTYGAVIIGPDVTWTPQGWLGRPEYSCDGTLRRLPPREYLRYALNAYYVLATRGTKGTRLYSVDPATQEHLRTLLPGADAGR